jgi:hypothetical protein
MELWRGDRCTSQCGVTCLLVTAGLLVATCGRDEPRPAGPASAASSEVGRLETPAVWPQLADIPLAVKPVAIPPTERECHQAGGLWAQRGLGGGPFRCDFEAGDARKICTDSLQCEGECLVAKDIPVGSRAIGSCSDFVATYGCHSFIERGLVRSLCTD